MLERHIVVGFENIKRNALSKLDKSKKGEVDKRIQKLLDKINNKKNYFTTSSCSGRIVLLKKGKRKDKCTWLYVTHDLADAKEMWEKLSKAKGDVSLRMESMILHVCCRTLEDAEKFLLTARKLYKRAGIMSLKKLSIEVMGSDFLEIPVIVKDKLVVEEDYFKLIVLEANEKLKSNWRKTEKFIDFITIK